jgi:hypothetical protein
VKNLLETILIVSFLYIIPNSACINPIVLQSKYVSSLSFHYLEKVIILDKVTMTSCLPNATVPYSALLFLTQKMVSEVVTLLLKIPIVYFSLESLAGSSPIFLAF